MSPKHHHDQQRTYIFAYMVNIMETVAKHRYRIDTEHDKYDVDDYIMYVMHGIQSIKAEDDRVDVCFITAPVTAIHDFESGLTLEKFTEIREKEVQKMKLSKGSSGDTDGKELLERAKYAYDPNFQ